MDRKIVELLIAGVGVNQMARNLRVSKRRIRTLRKMALEYGYLNEEGSVADTPLPPYPEPLFPDTPDKRAIKTSPQFDLLEPHQGWIEERLKAGWHAVTVFEELPQEARAVTRSAFYRFLARHKLNPLGQEVRRVVPEIIHQAGEALLVDWGKLCEAEEPVVSKKKTVWIFTGILGYSRYLMVRLVWSNDVKTTLGVLEGLFREIGGVPRRVTSDNPKCFVAFGIAL